MGFNLFCILLVFKVLNPPAGRNGPTEELHQLQLIQVSFIAFLFYWICQGSLNILNQEFLSPHLLFTFPPVRYWSFLSGNKCFPCDLISNMRLPIWCFCLAPFILISQIAFGIFLSNLNATKSISWSTLFLICATSESSMLFPSLKVYLQCSWFVIPYYICLSASLHNPSNLHCYYTNILQKLHALLHYSELPHWLERNIIHSKWSGKYSCYFSCHVCSHSRHYKVGERIWEKACI